MYDIQGTKRSSTSTACLADKKFSSLAQTSIWDPTMIHHPSIHNNAMMDIHTDTFHTSRAVGCPTSRSPGPPCFDTASLFPLVVCGQLSITSRIAVWAAPFLRGPSQSNTARCRMFQDFEPNTVEMDITPFPSAVRTHLKFELAARRLACAELQVILPAPGTILHRYGFICNLASQKPALCRALWDWCTQPYRD
jgi:hypothetical protein